MLSLSQSFLPYIEGGSCCDEAQIPTTSLHRTTPPVFRPSFGVGGTKYAIQLSRELVAQFPFPPASSNICSTHFGLRYRGTQASVDTLPNDVVGKLHIVCIQMKRPLLLAGMGKTTVEILDKGEDTPRSPPDSMPPPGDGSPSPALQKVSKVCQYPRECSCSIGRVTGSPRPVLRYSATLSFDARDSMMMPLFSCGWVHKARNLAIFDLRAGKATMKETKRTL